MSLSAKSPRLLLRPFRGGIVHCAATIDMLRCCSTAPTPMSQRSQCVLAQHLNARRELAVWGTVQK